MNPDTPLTPREETEVRLTSMLMGELPPEEAAALQAQMAGDPELTALHARLRQAIELLREASAIPEQPAPPVPAQLSSERREKLLAHFKAPAPAPGAVIVRPRREWRKFVPLGLAASLIALLGGAVFLNGFAPRNSVSVSAPDFTSEGGDLLSFQAAETRWDSQPGAVRSFAARSGEEADGESKSGASRWAFWGRGREMERAETDKYVTSNEGESQFGTVVEQENSRRSVRFTSPTAAVPPPPAAPAPVAATISPTKPLAAQLYSSGGVVASTGNTTRPPTAPLYLGTDVAPNFAYNAPVAETKSETAALSEPASTELGRDFSKAKANIAKLSDLAGDVTAPASGPVAAPELPALNFTGGTINGGFSGGRAAMDGRDKAPAPEPEAAGLATDPVAFTGATALNGEMPPAAVPRGGARPALGLARANAIAPVPSDRFSTDDFFLTDGLALGEAKENSGAVAAQTARGWSEAGAGGGGLGGAAARGDRGTNVDFGTVTGTLDLAKNSTDGKASLSPEAEGMELKTRVLNEALGEVEVHKGYVNESIPRPGQKAQDQNALAWFGNTATTEQLLREESRVTWEVQPERKGEKHVEDLAQKKMPVDANGVTNREVQVGQGLAIPAPEVQTKMYFQRGVDADSGVRSRARSRLPPSLAAKRNRQTRCAGFPCKLTMAPKPPSRHSMSLRQRAMRRPSRANRTSWTRSRKR